MLLEEADRDTFKQWIEPKLEQISDADSGVLADYVIALIIADESEDAVKNNCLDSLSDFLQDPKPFVDQVIQAVKDRSFSPRSGANAKPAQPSPIPVAPIISSPRRASIPVSTSRETSISTRAVQRFFPSSLSAEAPPFSPPDGPAAAALNSHPYPIDRLTGSPLSLQAHTPDVGVIQNGQRSLKRKLKDKELSRSGDGQDQHHKRSAGGDRPVRQTTRKGGRNPQSGSTSHGLFPGAKPRPTPNAAPITPMPNLPALPFPPGLPPFNPADPMSFLTMAAALGMGFPGMAQMPFASPLAMGLPGSNSQPHLASRQEQCDDYITKGYCVLGSVCPYQHGGEVIQSTDEYDPENASLAVIIEKNTDRQRDRSHRTNAEGRFGGRIRAPFSDSGPTTDPTNVTIVVEQIPKEHFSKDAIRGFFSQFGEITSVEMQAYKRLAIVKYKDHSGASRAYDSPKVIFDNRFVKVYWLKDDSLTEPPINGRSISFKEEIGLEEPLPYDQDEIILNAEEIEKRQAEAQIAWEERQKKVQEAAAKLEDVQEQILAKEDEIRELSKKVAEKDGVEFVDERQDISLMEQLKSLQAEALDLGLHSQASEEGFAARGRGWRGYRGRFPTRARGGYRGRGAPYMSAGARTGVKRLDNRTRRLAVAGIESGSARDEALRQHLLNGYEIDEIASHPTEEHTLIISFKERYMAEMFLDASLRMPDVGKLELSWVLDSPTPPTAPSNQKSTNGDVKMDEVVESIETGQEGDEAKVPVNGGDVNGNDSSGGDNDYDVADDVDEWL